MGIATDCRDGRIQYYNTGRKTEALREGGEREREKSLRTVEVARRICLKRERERNMGGRNDSWLRK